MAPSPPIADVPSPTAPAQPAAVAGAGFSMLSAILSAGLVFGALEAGASMAIARVWLPSLVAGADLARLPELRDQISLLIFGVTAVASAVAALVTARSARRGGRGLRASAASAAIGIAAAIGAGVVLAYQLHQAIVPEALATQAATAGVGVLVGSFAGTVIFRGASRPRNRAALPVGVGVVLAFQIVAPTAAFAASDITPRDCGQVTWSGSLEAALTAMSLDAGLDFGFEATQNLDQSWDLKTAGGLKVGFKFAAGEEASLSGLDLDAATNLARLHLEITNDAVGKVGYDYHFTSTRQLIYVVAGSLATLAWQIQALPGLTTLLPDGPVLPMGASVPPPVTTEYELGGKTSVKLGIGPMSTSFELANSLSVHLIDPDPESPFDESRAGSVEMGFAQSGAGTFTAKTPGFGGMTFGVDQAAQVDARTYITFANMSDRVGDPQWVLQAVNLSVSGEMTPIGPNAQIGPQLLAQTAKSNGIAGVIGRDFKELGLKVDHRASGTLDAHLEHIDRPDVALALLRVMFYSASLADSPAIASDLDRLGRLVPALQDLSSEDRAIEALLVLVDNSRVGFVVETSDSAKLGLKVGAGDGVAFGAEIAAKGGRKALVVAFYTGNDASLRESKTCVAAE